jgi:LuxR family maltose regulon positive regulatory protein
MSKPLLTTELHMPPLRRELVPRPRLIERLSKGLGRKVMLISASADFGKTTLLGEWARGCGRRVALFTLDEGDNDPTRFLAYIV